MKGRPTKAVALATLVDLLHLEPVHVRVFRRWSGIDIRGWRRWLADLAKAGIPVIREGEGDHEILRLDPEHAARPLPGTTREMVWTLEAQVLALREQLDAKTRQVQRLERLVARLDQRQAAK